MVSKAFFVSYLSLVVDDLIREAIEAAGVTCWIALRDLHAAHA